MANADMCLDAARKAFPDNEELRVAYMIGFNDGFDRAMEQPEVDLEKEVKRYFMDSGYELSSYECYSIARHFYELGRINTRKEE